MRKLMCLVGLLASGTALAAPARLSIYSQATNTWRDASIRFVHMLNTNVQVAAQTATNDWVYCNISGANATETREILEQVRGTVTASGGAVLCYVPQHSATFPAWYYVNATGYGLNFNGPL
jgi:acyl-CoA thioesterase